MTAAHTARAGTQRPVIRPRTDVMESGDALVLVADMPGVDEETVSVVFDRGRLVLTGHAVPHDPEGLTLQSAEYESADYEIAFQLPEKIDPESIEGSIRHGVLRVTVPRRSPAPVRKIDIRAG